VANANLTASNSSCGQSNGSIAINATGGSGSYTYLWSTTPPQTTQTVTNLAAGAYTVTISDLGLNCSFIKTATLIDIAGPVAYLNYTTNTECGENNGAISVSISGGSAPFTYQWNSVPPQSTPDLMNVPYGYYCLTVFDNNECTATLCDSVNAIAYAAPDICMVTVDTASNHNQVIWEKPVTTGIDKYYIFRETNISGIYNLIGYTNYTDMSTYLDTNSNSLQQSYRYRISIHDNCGLTSLQSAFHQTLHLSINAGMGGAWNLTWNDYLGFSFSTYNIYRGTTGGNLSLINSVSSNVTSYTDLTPPPGVVYYMIEVVRPTACTPSAKTINEFSSSISNVANPNANSIDAFSIDNIVQVYPNPATGSFTVSFTDPSFTYSDIKIMDSPGRIVYHSLQTKPSESIDISNISKGVYFLAIKINERVYYKKLLLQ
jgi:hypothetical protein